MVRSRWSVVRILVGVTVFLFLPPTVFSEEFAVSAQVDKTELAQGEALSYSITIAGPIREEPKVNLGAVKGFHIVSSSQSHQLSVRAGQIQRSVVLSYLLTPVEPGVHTLGPVKVTYRGKVYETQPIEVKVAGRAGAPRPKLEGGVIL